MEISEIIDLEIFAEIKEALEEDFGEFLDQFFDDAGGWIADLAGAVDEGNADVVYQLAHTLKSSSGYVGAIQLQETARQLEACGRAGKVEDRSGLLKEAQAQFQALQVAIRDLLEGASD